MNEDKLFHLLEKKRGFFETFLDLCREESEIGCKEYRDILEQKQILLSYVEEIDKELNSFQACCTVLSEEIQHEMGRIKDLIESILECDQLNAQKRKKSLKILGRYGAKK